MFLAAYDLVPIVGRQERTSVDGDASGVACRGRILRYAVIVELSLRGGVNDTADTGRYHQNPKLRFFQRKSLRHAMLAFGKTDPSLMSSRFSETV